jgi:hypothetical protein
MIFLETDSFFDGILVPGIDDVGLTARIAPIHLAIGVNS